MGYAEVPARHVIRKKAVVTVTCNPDAAYDYISSGAVLPDWLCQCGPIAGVRAVEVLEGPYARVGAKRLVTFENGDRIEEELIDWHPFAGYSYRVSGFSDFLRHLTDAAYGQFWFERTEGRTRITWVYTYTYKTLYGRLVLWLFNRLFFHRFMQQGLRNAKIHLQT